jgi:hypothetical protein
MLLGPVSLTGVGGGGGGGAEQAATSSASSAPVVIKRSRLNVNMDQPSYGCDFWDQEKAAAFDDAVSYRKKIKSRLRSLLRI